MASDDIGGGGDVVAVGSVEVEAVVQARVMDRRTAPPAPFPSNSQSANRSHAPEAYTPHPSPRHKRDWNSACSANTESLDRKS